ncbi:kinase-like domain-containing protein [Hygrophoropsis aurantiaca]|uniref:Kinase-like domain-containing protein n=1 Tax=Hygrophoropsis aurantiaca TaxID=72124 RepID=A0ACB8AGM0_9AGAM|nr:kinase-like domain-containing protein [Hygrophoropsis aurantiaca]
MFVLQVFYDGRVGEKVDGKVFSSITKLFTTGPKRSKSSVPSATEVEGTPTSGQDTVALTSSRSLRRSEASSEESTGPAGMQWPSSASIHISPVGILPPISFASMESILINDVADAFHDPEVLDIRRTIHTLPMIKEFFRKEKNATDRKSPLRFLVSSPKPLGWKSPFKFSLKSATAPANSAPSTQKLSFDDFVVRKHIGSGANGSVCAVEHRLTGKQFALKVVKKGKSESHMELILVEQAAMMRLTGKKDLLQLQASFHDTVNLYILMPYLPVGDMHKQIVSWSGIPLDIVRFYAAELIVSLESIHRRGIIHRDLKPGNILIDDGGHAFIADFGLAKIFPDQIPDGMSPYAGPGTAYGMSQFPYMTQRCCGTPDYMAPEVFNQVSYGFGIDFWALGITIYEMLVGNTPWDACDSYAMATHVRKSDLIFPSDIDKTAQDFLSKMLAKKPKDRLSYEQMLEHEFFKGIDWKKISNHTAYPPYVPVPDVEGPSKIEPSTLIRRGKCYDQANDPLPRFNYVSPTMGTRPSWKSKIRNTFGRLNRYVRKSFSRRTPVPMKRIQSAQPPVIFPQQARPPAIIVNDDEVTADWCANARRYSTRKPVPITPQRRPVPIDSSSACPISSRQPPNATPAKEHLALPALLQDLRKRHSSGLALSPGFSPTPTLVGSPVTLVASSANASLKFQGAMAAKGDNVKNWISHIWHPIPTVTSCIGDNRKILDLTA